MRSTAGTLLALLAGSGCGPQGSASPPPVHGSVSSSVFYASAYEPLPDPRVAAPPDDVVLAVWPRQPDGAGLGSIAEPEFIAHESGRVVYRRQTEQALGFFEVTLPPSGLRRLLEQVDPEALARASPVLDCEGAEREDYRLAVRDPVDPDRWVVRQVYALGSCRGSLAEDPVAVAFDYLTRWRHPDAHRYEPEWVELTLTLAPLDVQTSGTWPSQLPRPTVTDFGATEHVFALDPGHFSTIASLGALSDDPPAYLLDGRAWHVRATWAGWSNDTLDCAELTARETMCLDRARARARCFLRDQFEPGVDRNDRAVRLGCARALLSAAEGKFCVRQPLDMACRRAAPECPGAVKGHGTMAPNIMILRPGECITAGAQRL